MFLPVVEVARLCRRLRVAYKTNIHTADDYWWAIDETIAQILKRNRL